MRTDDAGPGQPGPVNFGGEFGIDGDSEALVASRGWPDGRVINLASQRRANKSNVTMVDFGRKAELALAA